MRHGLFPMHDDRNGQATGTDTFGALTEALSQLNLGQSASIPAEDAIVLFSDGEANCRKCSADYSYPGEASDCRTNPLAACANAYYNYAEAQKAIRNLVDTEIAGKNIAIHVFPIGAAVAPLKARGVFYPATA